MFLRGNNNDALLLLEGCEWDLVGLLTLIPKGNLKMDSRRERWMRADHKCSMRVCKLQF